ncbi:MAG: hypothetical protein FWH11_03245 [Micrococcales bacterium]|nr:hypothetical protein [Micrococcales bacterium]
MLRSESPARTIATRRTLKYVVGLALTALALSSAVACSSGSESPQATPTKTATTASVLPVPTGQYTVGTQYLHLVDDDRDNAVITGSTAPREIMVQVLYPAEDDATVPYRSYARGSAELVVPPPYDARLTAVTTHAKENLALADDQSRYPVVLFSHGLGVPMELYTSQYEDLASHGYVVVAVDHTYLAGVSLLPGGSVELDEAAYASLEEKYPGLELAEMESQIMTDDAVFVIDALTELDDGTRDSGFAGRLDLDRLGITGHSLGGATAYELALTDSRIKAAINMDGGVWTAPQDGATPAPFLMLSAPDGAAELVDPEFDMCSLETLTEAERNQLLEEFEDEAAYVAECREMQEGMRAYTDGLAGVLAASQTLFVIEGSAHLSYTDLGLFAESEQELELIGLGSQIKPQRALEITQAVTLAFFDQHLKGDTTVTLDSLVDGYAELRHVELG